MAAQSDLRFIFTAGPYAFEVVEPRPARLNLPSDWRIFQTLGVPGCRDSSQ